jgi:neurofibromin 1
MSCVVWPSLYRSKESDRRQSNPVDEADIRQTACTATALDRQDRLTLHSFIIQHADRVGALLLSTRPSRQLWHDGTETPSPQTGKLVWDQLTNIIFQLEDHDATLAADVENHRRRQELRTSHEAARWAEVFVETARSRVRLSFGTLASTENRLSQRGHRCFLINTRLVPGTTGDLDSLAHYIASVRPCICVALLQGLRGGQRLANSSDTFDLLLDCTGFTSRNEVPLAWLRRVQDILAPQVVDRFGTLYIFCPGPAFQRFGRKAVRAVQGVLPSVRPSRPPCSVIKSS